MLKQFRDFLLRGSVVDLAVAVVVGAAFGAVVASFVSDLLTPLIAAIGGKRDFSALSFTINGSRFRYGSFINAVLSFVIVAAAVFFVVVRPVSALMERRKAGLEPEAEAVSEDVVLLGEIRDLLRAGV
jgi:large conductance mechanosensitive channel